MVLNIMATDFISLGNKVYRDSETQCIVGRNGGRFLCSFYDSRTQRLYLCVGSTAPSRDILLFAINLIEVKVSVVKRINIQLNFNYYIFILEPHSWLLSIFTVLQIGH